jgi:hypothetical protein
MTQLDLNLQLEALIRAAIANSNTTDSWQTDER